MFAIKDVKAAIRSGRHQGWKREVYLIAARIAPIYDLPIVSEGLIVAFRDEKHWFYTVVPPNAEGLYDQIASYYREIPAAPLAAVMSELGGSVLVLASSKPQERGEVAMCPLGVAIIAKDEDSQFWDKTTFGFAEPEILPEVLGQSKQTVADEVDQLVWQWAGEQILAGGWRERRENLIKSLGRDFFWMKAPQGGNPN